jgi:hypothetical protein
MRKRFLRIGEHLVKGSPVKPGGQLQIGLWFITLQRAWSPHVPGQGFIHLWLLHAWFWGHSELTTHSGLHDGGLPTKLGWQEHTAWPLVTLHTLFGPHGDGSQGLCGGTAAGKEISSFVAIFMWFLNLQIKGATFNTLLAIMAFYFK